MEEVPEFPEDLAELTGYSPEEQERIAAAAWRQSNGSVDAFRGLIAEHHRGAIDLFAHEKGADEQA